MRSSIATRVVAAVLCVLMGSYAVVLSRPPSDAAAPTGQSASAAPLLESVLASKVDPCPTQPVLGCWETFFEEVTKEEGITVALESVHTLGEIFPVVLRNCHEYKHSIGREAINFIQSPEEAFTYDDRSCQYGFRHGILEAFATRSDEAGLIASMKDLCDTSEGFDYGECLHALGHSAGVFEPTDVVKAVNYCDYMEGNDDEKLACSGGAFMEYANSFVLKHTGVGIEDDTGAGTAVMTDEQANKLCDNFRGKFEAECWMRVGLFWGALYGERPDLLLPRCPVEAGQHAKRCAESIGEWLMRYAYEAGNAFANDPQLRSDKIAEKLISMCSAGPEDLLGPCLRGSVLPMRRNDMWERNPKENWIQVCVHLPEGEAKSLCTLAEDQAKQSVTDIPDPEARARANL